MRILITGANGFIGRQVCKAAAELGHKVNALIRCGNPSSGYPVADSVYYGQLPYNIPEGALDEVECVIHLAAATTGQNKVEAHAVNVEGTAYLLDMFKKKCPEGRFVFISTQSARENAAANYGKTKYLAEELVRESGMAHCIIRPGLVIGSAGRGLFHRMRRLVRKSPVVPLLAGGRALIQPVEVQVLAEAILKCVDLPLEKNLELNLGDPDGLTMKELLRMIVKAEIGKKRIEVPIPTLPVKIALRFAETLRIPMPISMDNILGLESVERMETRSSYEELGLVPEPVQEMVYKIMKPAPVTQSDTSPLKVLLVGAGKIGIVHALNLLMREGIALCGIVDKRSSAMGLYKTIGIRTKYFSNMDDAIQKCNPDCVMICTPASTHYALAKKCVEMKLPVLLEKPMGLSASEFDSFRELAVAAGAMPIHVGYMAAQHPHLDAAVTMLRNGELGKVLGFRGFALQSHIMASKPVSWEMKKASSGGGVIINYAGHLLAIIRRLFADPHSVECSAWKIYSVDVEDAAEMSFQYPAFQGRVIASWSIPGYDRPMYRLSVDCEHGSIVFDNTAVMLLRNGKMTEIRTQLDCSATVGYNSAPDYTGGAFAREHKNFARAVALWKSGKTVSDADVYNTAQSMPSRTPVTVMEATAVEQLIQSLYEAAQKHGGTNLLTVDRYVAAKDNDKRMDEILAELKKVMPTGGSR